MVGEITQRNIFFINTSSNHTPQISSLTISPSLYNSSKLFTLISPSPSGLRKFPKEVLLELPKVDHESNKDYRLRYYNFVLSNN